jgi:small-conductance mechanosensitive channel
MVPGLAGLTETIAEQFDAFVLDILGAIPRLLSGIVFLALASVLIRIVQMLVRRTLSTVYPADQELIVDFGVLVVGVFLWFGALLALLSVVGLGAIAASLGTAVGFLALGISYALSDMVADTVAGIYLLRDPDFGPGDRVITADTTGVVESIGLRKSRVRLDDGNKLVLANRDVEKRWVKVEDDRVGT